MARSLKARRVGGGTNPLIWILVGLVLGLLALLVVLLANSPLLGNLSAEEIARREALAALNENPDDPGLLMTLAEIEHAMGRESDALDHARQASENAGDTATIRLRHAMILVQEGMLDEARTALEGEIEIDPMSGESYFLLAQVMGEQRDLEGAIEAAEQALLINPIDGDVRILYAQLLAEDGRDEEAEAAYLSALQVLPNDPRAIEGLADLGVTYEPTDAPSPH